MASRYWNGEMKKSLVQEEYMESGRESAQSLESSRETQALSENRFMCSVRGSVNNFTCECYCV